MLTTDRVAIHCMSTVLKGWVEERGVTIGDRVAIRYNGKKESEKSGRTFDDFSKTVQKAAEVPGHLRPAAGATFLGSLDEPF
jgi:hypothetical protein